MDVRFSDGSTTYDLNTGDTITTAYTPTVGDRNKDRVTDTLELFIAAGAAVDQQAAKDEINSWLALAREQWETVNVTRIYIEIKQAGEADWRRSELLGGRLQPMPGTLDGHSLYKQAYQMIIERRNWWEWPEEELPLSIDNETFATGGVYISNGQAVVSVNPNSPAIFMQAVDITGDPQSPVPVRLEITSQDTSRYIDRLFISHNVFSELDALTNQHLVLANSATDPLPLDDGTDTDGTNYVRLWQSGGGQATLTMPLSSARLTALGGRWYRLIARVKTDTATEPIYGKFELFSTDHVSENAIASTEYMYIAADPTAGYDLIDFGAMRLPTLATSVASYDLELKFSVRSSAAFEVWLDFIQLSPVDSFHHIETTNTSAFNPEYIIADGRIGRTYLVPEANYALDGFADVSEHISLWPGRDQWITILHRNRDELMEYTQLLYVQIYYRPRRVTV